MAHMSYFALTHEVAVSQILETPQNPRASSQMFPITWYASTGGPGTLTLLPQDLAFIFPFGATTPWNSVNSIYMSKTIAAGKSNTFLFSFAFSLSLLFCEDLDSSRVDSQEIVQSFFACNVLRSSHLGDQNVTPAARHY
jgi:hypothetical protein